MMIKDHLTNSNAEKTHYCGGTSNSNNQCSVNIPPNCTPTPKAESPPNCIPTPKAESPPDCTPIPKAELLHKAGIKFKTGQLRFAKRRFGNGTLYLPQILIEDNTEIRLRNLMAYEDCQSWSWPSEDTVISHFVALFDDLIDSDKDVSVLIKAQVIQKYVGSDEEIARMFNRLCHQIGIDSIEKIEVVMKEVTDHYQSKWKVWMSQFKEEHCSKPWKFLSLVAAILILGMAIVQTVFSVK
ncbi:hypothetical protein SUGI_0694740 [Cryptomeria japonica]|nr:hypothetical protein SUGI_0694740 [Cryptomeria japonica]